MEETLNEQYGAKIKELSILKSKHQKLDERKSKALELFLDSSITKNEYDPLVQSIKEEKFLI